MKSFKWMPLGLVVVLVLGARTARAGDADTLKMYVENKLKGKDDVVKFQRYFWKDPGSGVPDYAGWINANERVIEVKPGKKSDVVEWVNGTPLAWPGWSHARAVTDPWTEIRGGVITLPGGTLVQVFMECIPVWVRNNQFVRLDACASVIKSPTDMGNGCLAKRKVPGDTFEDKTNRSVANGLWKAAQVFEIEGTGYEIVAQGETVFGQLYPNVTFIVREKEVEPKFDDLFKDDFASKKAPDETKGL